MNMQFPFDDRDPNRAFRKCRLVGLPHDLPPQAWDMLEGFVTPRINYEAAQAAGLDEHPCPWRYATEWERDGAIERTGVRRQGPKSGRSHRSQFEKVITSRGLKLLAWRAQHGT